MRYPRKDLQTYSGRLSVHRGRNELLSPSNGGRSSTVQSSYRYELEDVVHRAFNLWATYHLRPNFVIALDVGW